MSRTTTSGWSLANSSRSFRPSVTVPTISNSGSSKHLESLEQQQVIVGQQDSWTCHGTPPAA